MTLQIWVQCQKREVQNYKCILESIGQLDSNQKVKPSPNDGYMIIPTNIRKEQEADDGLQRQEILDGLGLPTIHLDPAVEILYLPSPTGQDSSIGTIGGAIQKWLEAVPYTIFQQAGITQTILLSNSPKRWSVYEPMLLLPSSSFQDLAWRSLLQNLDQPHQELLWESILRAVWVKEGGKQLTHLAVNAGIPSKQGLAATTESENILRSPSSLVMLYGDFGREPTPGPADMFPTEKDFEEAFWVTTKQNGIYQTWAPRYTMFSRGNIKEKARILSFHNPNTAISASRKGVSPQELSESVAVDLYAGIGYFAFSYVAMGMGRVICWEINPWSVEGLRRGMGKNGWSVKITRGEDLSRPLWELLRNTAEVLVLEESNERAADRIQDLRRWEKTAGERILGNILHVNCGFLPFSEPSWPIAWCIVCKQRQAWLHLHENVDIRSLERRKTQIATLFQDWASPTPAVELEHVELVKTFAPDIWHCVVDVHIAPL